MEGLGTPDGQSADLMSYLLFDGAYTRALIDIGYRDAGERVDEIEAFLRSGRTGQTVALRRPPRPTTPGDEPQAEPGPAEREIC